MISLMRAQRPQRPLPVSKFPTTAIQQRSKVLCRESGYTTGCVMMSLTGMQAAGVREDSVENVY